MKSQEKLPTANTDSDNDGGSWQFKLVLSVIALGVLGLIGKVFGFF